MRSKRHPSKGKKIKPHFWAFCEGETEEEYLYYLKNKYRAAVEIKITGNGINESKIKKYKQGKPIHEKDKDFLIYDADVPETLAKLDKIKNAVQILSNPSIELWFLLHYKNQQAFIKSEDCIRELSNRNGNYDKGKIDNKLKKKLDEGHDTACERGKSLNLNNNPSSNMFDLIEELKKNKR